MSTDLLASVEQGLRAHFAQTPARASVSFVGVDPIEVLRFTPAAGERIYVSLGMARHPMTPPSHTAVAPDGPRAELLLHLLDRSDRFADIWRRLAVLAAAPAVEGVVYGAAMTVDLGEPLVPGSRATGAIVADSPVAPIPTPAGLVTVFQLLPATSSELAWARVRGTAALMACWQDQAIDLREVSRPSVAFD